MPYSKFRLCEKISVKSKTAAKNNIGGAVFNDYSHFLQYTLNTVNCQGTDANYPDEMERSGMKSG